MATRSIAFRLNDKNREDKEIMEWLDKVVYEGEYYESLTEAVKVGNSMFCTWRNPISGGNEHHGAYAGVCQGFC